MRVFLFWLLLTSLAFGQGRTYLKELIVSSNNRPISGTPTVKLYNTGTLTFVATLTKQDNSPGRYYWTGGTSTVPWGDYDIYVNFTPTTLADTVHAYLRNVDIRNGYTISQVARDTVAAVLSDSAYAIDPIRGTGTLATSSQIGYLDSMGIRSYLELGKNLTAAHFGVNPDSGAPLSGFSTSDRIRAARWNARRLQAYFDFCYNPTNTKDRQQAIIPSAKYYLAPQEPGSGLQYCLNIRNALAVIGAGTGRFGNGTQLILVDSVAAVGDTIVMLATNGFVDEYIEEVVVDRFWHESQIKGVYLNANGDNQASGSYQWGIGIVDPGETSYITEIFIGGFVGRALHYQSPAPNFDAGHMSVFPANRASHNKRDYERVGYWHLNGGGNFSHTSGDECNPLHYITGGGPGNYIFTNNKVEELGLFQDQTCFWLEDTEQWLSVFILGGRFDKSTTDTAGALILVEVDNSGKLPYRIEKTATKNSGFPNLLIESVDNAATFDTLWTSPQKTGGVYGKVSANNANNLIYGVSNDLYYRSHLLFEGKGGNVRYIKATNTDRDTINVLSYSSSEDRLYFKSNGDNMTLLNKSANTWLDLSNTVVKVPMFARFEGGLRIGPAAGAVTVDTLKQSADGDSVQFKINGLGWRAIRWFNSEGN